MSKSVRNTIDLEDSPDEMFGKVMSIPDGLIRNYAELAAWYSRREVEVMIKRLGRENPRDVKFDLAEAIVGRYHGARAAARARARFVKTFSRREAPALARSIRLPRGRYTPLELLERLGAVRSKSEARRLASARAVEVDGRIVTPRDEPVDLRRGSVIRIGKKRFWRVR